MPIARAKPRTCLDRRRARTEVGPLRSPGPPRLGWPGARGRKAAGQGVPDRRDRRRVGAAALLPLRQLLSPSAAGLRSRSPSLGEGRRGLRGRHREAVAAVPVGRAADETAQGREREAAAGAPRSARPPAGRCSSPAACGSSTPRGTSSTRASGPPSAGAAARRTSRSATGRTSSTASRASADAVPGRVVPVLGRRARDPDRARPRLRRAPGRAVARAAGRVEGCLGLRPDPHARDRGRPLLQRDARGLRVPARARRPGSTRPSTGAASSTTSRRANRMPSASSSSCSSPPRRPRSRPRRRTPRSSTCPSRRSTSFGSEAGASASPPTTAVRTATGSRSCTPRSTRPARAGLRQQARHRRARGRASEGSRGRPALPVRRELHGRSSRGARPPRLAPPRARHRRLGRREDSARRLRSPPAPVCDVPGDIVGIAATAR